MTHLSPVIVYIVYVLYTFSVFCGDSYNIYVKQASRKHNVYDSPATLAATSISVLSYLSQ